MSASNFLTPSGGQSTYEIGDLNQLENSAASLARYNQEITNNTSSLSYILRSVNENWQNEQGQDIQSIMTSLEDSIRVLNEDIQPILKEYSTTINNVVTETRATQSRDL